jgi:hypothetical protein
MGLMFIGLAHLTNERGLDVLAWIHILKSMESFQSRFGE